MDFGAGEQAVIDAALHLESLLHPKHATKLTPLRAKLAKMLTRRFRRQKKDFLSESKRWLKWLADKYGESKHLNSGAALRGMAVLLEEVDENARVRAQVKHAITVNIETGKALTSDPSQSDEKVYDSVMTAGVEAAKRTISVDLAIEYAQEQATAYAEKYLRENAFKQLAADIDDTSRERIANAVADVYAGGGSYDDAVRAIEEAFDGMTEDRAERIATTELANVYNSAMLDSAKEVGGMVKSWATESDNPCEECIANEDQGPIGLDEDFQSGDDAPPAHPSCLCSVTFEKEDEED